MNTYHDFSQFTRSTWLIESTLRSYQDYDDDDDYDDSDDGDDEDDNGDSRHDVFYDNKKKDDDGIEITSVMKNSTYLAHQNNLACESEMVLSNIKEMMITVNNYDENDDEIMIVRSMRRRRRIAMIMMIMTMNVMIYPLLVVYILTDH